MPASRLKRKPVKMSRGKSEQMLSNDQLSIYNRKNYILSEPIALSIMEEMDVMPLDDSPFADDCNVKTVVSKPQKVISQSANSGTQFHLSPPSPTLHSKYHKALRDDFVLFRKSQHSQPQGEDPFAKLSDEIILHIFQWLPKPVLVKCSRVCKRWQDLSYDETLWKRYDLGRKLIKPNVLRILIHRGVTVLRLAMSEIKSPVFSDCEMFGANGYRFCRLQYLDLSMATVAKEALADLLSVCRYLKKLSLENCCLNEDCCKYISQNKQLEVLNMAMCTGLTPLGLYEISVKCIKLKEWNLGWSDLTSCCMDAFLPILPQALRRLNMSGHRQCLNDDALITLVKRCESLIELDISDSPLLTEVSFEVLVASCSNLEHLHTSRSYSIPTSCNRLLKDMKNFKKLEIFRTLTDTALVSLREYMPKIQINDDVFSTIARPTTGIRRTSIWGLRVRD